MAVCAKCGGDVKWVHDMLIFKNGEYQQTKAPPAGYCYKCLRQYCAPFLAKWNAQKKSEDKLKKTGCPF